MACLFANPCFAATTVACCSRSSAHALLLHLGSPAVSLKRMKIHAHETLALAASPPSETGHIRARSSNRFHPCCDSRSNPIPRLAAVLPTFHHAAHSRPFANAACAEPMKHLDPESTKRLPCRSLLVSVSLALSASLSCAPGLKNPAARLSGLRSIPCHEPSRYRHPIQVLF